MDRPRRIGKSGDYNCGPISRRGRWLDFISPHLAKQREETRRRRYILLGDVTSRLEHETFDCAEVLARFIDLPVAVPFDERVAACILGVPDLI